MATQTARRGNLEIRTFSPRFCARVMPKKVALVACMRESLVILSAPVALRYYWEIDFGYRTINTVANDTLDSLAVRHIYLDTHPAVARWERSFDVRMRLARRASPMAPGRTPAIGYVVAPRLLMWKSPSVGVGIIFISGGEILLIKRRSAHGGGTWSTPGGYLDWGESPETCATRELLEETGLIVDSAEFLALTNDVFPDTDRHFVTLWMIARGPGVDRVVRPSDEAEAAGWYRADRLPAPLFACFENLVAGRSHPRDAWADLLATIPELASRPGGSCPG